MIKLFVTAAEVAVEENEIITEGRAGMQCRVRFSRDWEGLVKTAVFEGAESRDVILTGERVTIPAECLSAAGRSLKVGFYGKSTDGAVVIPTLWATLGRIENSVYPSGKVPAPPTPDVVAQIQQAAANAEKLARSVREDADLGKFKGSAGVKGDKGEKGDKGDTGADGKDGADGKSAYAYAVDGGYTGTEAEFAAKLAAEKFANPYSLTFTGAASGSYDGSEAVTVEIPSGGGGTEAGYKDSLTLLDVTLDDETAGLKNYEYDVSGIEKTDVIIINLLFPEAYTAQLTVTDQSDRLLASEFPASAKGMVIGLKATNGRYMHSCVQAANTAARADMPLSLFYGQISGASGFERPKAQDTITKIKFILSAAFVSGTRIRIYRW